MAATDPVIRWETEALRESAARRRPTAAAAPDRPHSHKKADWVTLRDAHYETGLPIETLRKWARRKHIPSEMRHTEHGERRVVDLLAVEERARTLGRPLEPVPEDLREAVDAESGPDVHLPMVEIEPETPEPGRQVVDLRDAGGSPTPVAPEADAPRDAPPDTMIVPIAAWDRMLMQLGNLHQAGQQLAEARERAAKAETEAKFLRERLAELRAAMEPPSDRAQAPDPVPRGADDAAEPVWRSIVRGWRTRRR